MDVEVSATVIVGDRLYVLTLEASQLAVRGAGDLITAQISQVTTLPCKDSTNP